MNVYTCIYSSAHHLDQDLETFQDPEASFTFSVNADPSPITILASAIIS